MKAMLAMMVFLGLVACSSSPAPKVDANAEQKSADQAVKEMDRANAAEAASKAAVEGAAE